jgi:hypothetical protein
MLDASPCDNVMSLAAKDIPDELLKEKYGLLWTAGVWDVNSSCTSGFGDRRQDFRADQAGRGQEARLWLINGAFLSSFRPVVDPAHPSSR